MREAQTMPAGKGSAQPTEQDQTQLHESYFGAVTLGYWIFPDSQEIGIGYWTFDSPVTPPHHPSARGTGAKQKFESLHPILQILYG